MACPAALQQSYARIHRDVTLPSRTSCSFRSNNITSYLKHRPFTQWPVPPIRGRPRKCFVVSPLSEYQKVDTLHQNGNLPPTESSFLAPKPAVNKETQVLKGGTVKDVLLAAQRAVEETPVTTVGTAAVMTGVAAVSTVVVQRVLASLDTLPMLPVTLQTLGVAYCGLVASRYISQQKVILTPLSPVKAIAEFVEGSHAQAAAMISQDLAKEFSARLRALTRERDAAVAKVSAMRKAEAQMLRVLAEKEALEAIAAQLAAERDSAFSEVTVLKTAVNSMTDRMRNIEAMLHAEVRKLEVQNEALETVALQLADERGAAIDEATKLKRLLAVSEADKEEVREEMLVLAARLEEERDNAVYEAAELRKVLNSLGSTGSGLSPQQEVFLKSRVRAIRAEYVDISVPYEGQKDAVDRLVKSLVDEYGAPSDWTTDYIRQFLGSSSEQSLGVKEQRSPERKRPRVARG